MPTVSMIAPSTFGGEVSGTPSGTVYAPAPGGVVAAQSEDVPILTALGFTPVPSVVTMPIPVTDLRSAVGVGLTATATGGAFGIAQTLGTSTTLKSEVAKNSSVTDTASAVVTLPPSFPAGENLTLTVNANAVPGSGTLSVKTVDATARVLANDGTVGSDLVATAAQTITNSADDYDFTITGTSLEPNSTIVLSIVMALTETADANAHGLVNSVRLGV